MSPIRHSITHFHQLQRLRERVEVAAGQAVVQAAADDLAVDEGGDDLVEPAQLMLGGAQWATTARCDG